jgi:plasmid stabilization system protein ParE
LTHRVRFHPLASAEIAETESWYEDRSAGLGDRFLAAVRAALDRIASGPGVGAPSRVDEKGAVVERRIATVGFPYVIEYRVGDHTILVLAVHHERRSPSYWADRIDDA